MRRFPLLPDPKRTVGTMPAGLVPDTGYFRRQDGIIEGAFVWAHDPVFRPLIAIYADGRLRQFGTTHRRPIYQRRSWPCCYAVNLDEDLAEREDLTVAIFETGAILRSPMTVERPITTVEELIEAGGRHAPPFAYGGFLSFLSLPLNDQIQIICRDILDRDATASEVRTYRRRVIDGEYSIVGLRDEIVLGDEAKEVCTDLTLHERRGRACLWNGLDLAFDSVIPAPLAHEDRAIDIPLFLRSAFEEITTPSDIRSILALNAVGDTSDIGAYAQWVAAHQDVVAATELRVSSSIEARSHVRSHRYRRGGLLALMKPGNAAARGIGGAVKATAGTAGVVIYGPYIPLEPGHHAVLFSLQTEAPAGEPLRLAFEVLHGDILLARRDIALSAAAQDVWRVAFTIPTGRQNLLRAPNFEFRLSTNGAAEITCETVSLDVCEDPHVGPASHPTVDNWLPALTPEVAGEQYSDGTICGLSASGRVFFGPYCKLLPGHYALALVYKLAADCVPKEVELEVVAGPRTVLARRRFQLEPGTRREELRFEIAESETAEELAGPLEFRLWKDAGFEFCCLTLELAIVDGSTA